MGFGISLMTGVIITFNISELMNWVFLIMGLLFLMAGSYTRFAEFDLEKIKRNERKLEILNVLVSASIAIISVLISVVLFLFKFYEGAIGMIIFLIVYMIFTYLRYIRPEWNYSSKSNNGNGRESIIF